MSISGRRFLTILSTEFLVEAETGNFEGMLPSARCGDASEAEFNGPTYSPALRIKLRKPRSSYWPNPRLSVSSFLVMDLHMG